MAGKLARGSNHISRSAIGRGTSAGAMMGKSWCGNEKRETEFPNFTKVCRSSQAFNLRTHHQRFDLPIQGEALALALAVGNRFADALDLNLAD